MAKARNAISKNWDLEKVNTQGANTTIPITVYNNDDSEAVVVTSRSIDFINPDGFSGVSLKASNQSENLGELLIPDVGATPKTIALTDDVSNKSQILNKTTTEINAIASPVEGEQYYNTTLHTICFYNGTNWQKVTSTNM